MFFLSLLRAANIDFIYIEYIHTKMMLWETVMESLISCKKSTFKMPIQDQGFAVLTTALLLSLASIIFTTNMAFSQLVNNQVVANYYRHNEAFSSAESGINFALSQLDNPQVAQQILAELPMQYINADKHYRVQVTKLHDSKLVITSSGSSIDGTAKREINLEIDFFLNYPIPKAPVSTNGKLNLDENSLINDGCEGLASESCIASGNIADNILVSNPNIEEGIVNICSGGTTGENTIASSVLKGEAQQKVISQINLEGEEIKYDWGNIAMPEGSGVAGLVADPNILANTLFEATFGIEMTQENLDELWSNASQVDMSGGGDCSEILQSLNDEDGIIYIKGDCDITQYHTLQSMTSENQNYTIGSIDHPKLIFIEGGKFTSAFNTQTKVIGMLYFLPGKHNLVDDNGSLIGLDGEILLADEQAIRVTDESIDIGGLNVNGALLSEYKCSYDAIKLEDKDSNRHLSVRFDKGILNELYSKVGVEASSSGYRFATGTWRDF